MQWLKDSKSLGSGPSVSSQVSDPTLHSIQALRALAAWAVVLHHYFLIFKVESLDSVLQRVFLQQGAAGVDVFFVISGFVMAITTNSRAAPREFLARRAARYFQHIGW